MFADDSTMIWTGRDSEELEIDVGNDLLRVKEWTDANLLTLNVKKTNIITFRCILNEVSVEDQILKSEGVNKFLGLYIDSKLRFDKHIAYIRDKLASNCYALRVISNNLDRTTTRTAYFSLIESHLRYGVCFWGYCARYLFNMIFILQKRAIRYMCKARLRDSCRPLFVTQKILSLPCLFILETASLIFKKFKSEINSESVHNTRQVFRVVLPIPNSGLTKNSIIFDGKKIFNHLPLSIRKSQSDRKFRREVKALLITRAYYSVDEFFRDNFS